MMCASWCSFMHMCYSCVLRVFLILCVSLSLFTLCVFVCVSFTMDARAEKKFGEYEAAMWWMLLIRRYDGFLSSIVSSLRIRIYKEADSMLHLMCKIHFCLHSQCVSVSFSKSTSYVPPFSHFFIQNKI